MAKFLHFGFNYHGRSAKTTELEETFDSAFDWYRYAANCWIAYTTKTPQQWYELLKPLLHANDTFLICEIDPKNRYGYLPEEAWNWLQKDRNSS